MPIIRGREAVVDLYDRARERRWVVPTFCTENQTTTEAVSYTHLTLPTNREV